MKTLFSNEILSREGIFSIECRDLDKLDDNNILREFLSKLAFNDIERIKKILVNFLEE